MRRRWVVVGRYNDLNKLPKKQVWLGIPLASGLELTSKQPDIV